MKWFAVAWLIAALPQIAAAETVAGPVKAEVVQVLDGDSLRVRAHPWPGIIAETVVRLRGLDAPETRGKCPAEKDAAVRARQALAGLAGSVVTLEQIEPDKFGGRMLARVISQDGRDVAAVMVASGLAREYDGGRRAGWCQPSD